MLKSKPKKLALVSFIIALLVIFSCGIVVIASATSKQDVGTASKVDAQTAELELCDSLTTKDIIRLLKNSDDLIDGFVNESTVEGRKYTGFYSVPKGIALEDAISDYEKSYYNGLIDSTIALEKRISTLNGKVKESAEIVLADYKLRISDIEKGRTSPNIKKVIMKGSKERITLFYAENKAENTWVPSWGSGYATTSSLDPLAVYMLADFGWDDDNSISGLKSDSNETLDVDIVFL